MSNHECRFIKLTFLQWMLMGAFNWFIQSWQSVSCMGFKLLALWWFLLFVFAHESVTNESNSRFHSILAEL